VLNRPRCRLGPVNRRMGGGEHLDPRRSRTTVTHPHGNRATPRAQRAIEALQPVTADPVEPTRTILNSAVAASEGTIRALERINQYARANTPVVFVGETGTGKSYFARGLHEASGRKGPFLDVTAGELDPSLALSQLFGHVRGSFTGAVGSRSGLLAEAAGGTLLLDDFHLMKRSLQAMLLRALERRVFRPVGSDRDIPLGCRIVVGMGAAPDLLVARRRLLPDLRYRLGHCVVTLPRLEDRRAEIPLLAQKFLSECPKETGVPGPERFGPGVTTVFETGKYPGNVRDLKERVRAGYLHAFDSDAVELRHLPDLGEPRLDWGRTREEKMRAVEWALRQTAGHVGRAAVLLGVHRNTLRVLRRSIGHSQHGTATSVRGPARSLHVQVDPPFAAVASGCRAMIRGNSPDA